MMKKALSILLAMLLLAGITGAALADAGARYRVTAARANLLSEPSAELTPVAEIPKGTVLTELDRSGSFIKVKYASAGITGWVHLGNLTPLPDGQTDVVRIYVETPPDKTVYVEGDELFDAAGLVVRAVYADGRDEALSGYTLLVPAFLTYGEKTVEVLYTDKGLTFYTSFTVTVAKVPVKEITLLTPPDKTEYIEHEPLDLSGLSVRVSYLDGRPDEIYNAAAIEEDPAFTLYGCHSEEAGKGVPFGEHTLQLMFRYPEFTVRFSVSARRRVQTGFRIVSDPDSLITYQKDDVPDLTGLKLEASYDNGETEILLPKDCEIACDPAAFVIGSGNLVTLSYGGFSVTLSFTYLPDEPVGIRIQTPTVLTFELGEPIDLSDLHVYSVFLSGKEEEVTDYRLSKIDPRLTGAQTLTVTYGSFADVFTIYITPYYQRGDINYDAKVTAADARLALRAAVGLITLQGKAFQAADADRSGDISAADARLILRAAVGLESLLHFEEEGE